MSFIKDFSFIHLPFMANYRAIWRTGHWLKFTHRIDGPGSISMANNNYQPLKTGQMHRMPEQLVI
jgi:hypothetical protein